jgi:hypothetical protein
VSPNKEMKLTSVERIGRSQLISGVRPTSGMRVRTRAVALGGLLLSARCGARSRPPLVAPAATPTGVTSVRVLDNNAKQPPPDTQVETITPAFASDDNELPVYPPYALRAGCGYGVVPIRVYVGTDGNVSTVKSISNRPVADDQCHSAFWAATSGAVQRWRFAPAIRQTPKPGADVDGDGRPDLTRWEQTPVMIYLDFEFTFRVVEGKGEVQPRRCGSGRTSGCS